MPWQIHIADASGVLAPYQHRIKDALARAEACVANACDPIDVDIIVQNFTWGVIPEVGIGGSTPNSWLIHLNCDPTNEHFEASLEERLERTVIHEANHAMRLRGFGGAVTLGEAIVSEGLAGQFVRQIYSNPPEPWEAPHDDDIVVLPDVIAAWNGPYDHAEWFFGAGDRPWWLGYRLGYRIVGVHIEKSGRTAAELTRVSADEFLDTVRSMST